MSLEEAVKEQISDIKNIISEIDNHSDDSKFFRELSQQAQWIANDIDRIHSGYYVAFIEVGPDDDFVRIYYPLGFMTAHEAYKILDEELDISDEPWNENGIIEVSEEIHNKYYDLIKIKELYDYIIRNKYELIAILPPNFIEDLKAKIDKLRNDLGFTRRWQHVCRKPYKQAQ